MSHHDAAISAAMQLGDDLEKLQTLTELSHECHESQVQIREHRSEIIGRLLEDGKSRRFLARELGISHTAVSALAARNNGNRVGAGGIEERSESHSTNRTTL